MFVGRVKLSVAWKILSFIFVRSGFFFNNELLIGLVHSVRSGGELNTFNIFILVVNVILFIVRILFL